ncbi:MAG: hypothetical protein FWH55_12180 [Oscillospiraceae bacterium]|nr:hypothetical protein [Oscillospiraceae bacterium]
MKKLKKLAHIVAHFVPPADSLLNIRRSVAQGFILLVVEISTLIYPVISSRKKKDGITQV